MRLAHDEAHVPGKHRVNPGNGVRIELVATDHPTAFVGALSHAHGYLAPAE